MVTIKRNAVNFLEKRHFVKDITLHIYIHFMKGDVLFPQRLHVCTQREGMAQITTKAGGCQASIIKSETDLSRASQMLRIIYTGSQVERNNRIHTHGMIEFRRRY